MCYVCAPCSFAGLPVDLLVHANFCVTGNKSRVSPPVFFYSSLSLLTDEPVLGL